MLPVKESINIFWPGWWIDHVRGGKKLNLLLDVFTWSWTSLSCLLELNVVNPRCHHLHSELVVSSLSLLSCFSLVPQIKFYLVMSVTVRHSGYKLVYVVLFVTTSNHEPESSPTSPEDCLWVCVYLAVRRWCTVWSSGRRRLRSGHICRRSFPLCSDSELFRTRPDERHTRPRLRRKTLVILFQVMWHKRITSHVWIKPFLPLKKSQYSSTTSDHMGAYIYLLRVLC